MKLSTKFQGKTMEYYAMKIFGVETFENLVAFFVDLFCEAYELERQLENNAPGAQPFYIVFLTRRFNVLAENFMRIFGELDENMQLTWARLSKLKRQRTDEIPTWDRCQEVFKRRVLTDLALRSQCGFFVQYYQKNGVFPKLIVCDELLIHGRTMNELLLDMEDRLIGLQPIFNAEDGIAEELKELEKLKLRHDFAKSLSLKVYAKSDDIVLLLPRYCTRLEVYTPHMKKSEWRELSMNFSRLVNVSTVNNVAFSLSFSAPLSGMEESESRGLLRDGESFKHYHTEIEDYAQDSWVYFYPNAKQPKVISTVRGKRSIASYAGEQHDMVVPFQIYGDLRRENVYLLFGQLLDEIRQDFSLPYKDKEKLLSFMNSGNADDEQDYTRIAWLNELFIGKLLLERFLEETNSDTRIMDYLEDGMLSRTFGWINESTMKVEDTTEEIQWILREWEPAEPIEFYLDLLTDNCAPIWNHDIFGTEISQQAIRTFERDSLVIQAALDAISEIGIASERYAYNLQRVGMFFSERELSSWGEMPKFAGIMERCRKHFRKKGLSQSDGADIYQVTAILIQAMDIGLLGMSVERNDSEQLMFTKVKAGEQTLSILPLRYALINESLERIVRNHQKEKDGIPREIKAFAEYLKWVGLYKDIKDLDMELQAYVTDLLGSGQTLSEWALVSENSSLEIQMDIRKYLEADLYRSLIERRMSRYPN